MNISDILKPDCVSCAVSSPSKKRALEQLSNLIIDDNPELTGGEIFESLISREKLGSTGIGHGVAIPHGRVHTDGKSIGAFIQLSNDIDYDSIDSKPVDLMFGLLVPEHSTDEHLQILSTLAQMFSDEPFCEKLRSAENPEVLYSLLTQWSSSTTE